MTAVILLGAGYGTRLKPLTEECPKALVPVGDRPLLAHQIDRLRASLGNATIVVNTHHFSEQIVAFLHSYDCNVQVIVELTLLGTAGGVRGATNLLGYAPLLVANVDVFSRPNYPRLMNIAESTGLALSIAPRPSGQGTVGIDEGGHIIRIRGEIFGVEVRGGDYRGVAAIGAEVARRLPQSGCLIADFILPLLRSGFEVLSVDEPSPWLDIGNLASYARANFDWLHENALNHWAGSNAHVGTQVDLQESIVGQGASIHGSGVLSRAIIWPMAHLDTPRSDAIVTTRGVVVPIPFGVR